MYLISVYFDDKNTDCDSGGEYHSAADKKKSV